MGNMANEGVAIGISIVTLVLVAVLILAGVNPAFKAFRDAYIKYVDIFIVIGVTIVALLMFAISFHAYRIDGNPRIAFVAAAFFLFSVKLLLTLLDVISGPNKWLIDAAAHLMDFGILVLFFAGAVSR